MTIARKYMPIGLTLGAFLLCTGLTATMRAGEHPKQFVWTSFDVPGWSGSISPQGINDSGDIVGNLIDAQGVFRHGFLMRPGEAAVIIDYPGAGGEATAATGINAQGDIVGWYRLPGEGADPAAFYGYLLSRKGRFTAIGYPGHPRGLPQRITSTGIILGCYHDLDTMDSMHGFTRSADGSFTGFPLSPSMHNGAAPDGSGIVGLYENETGRTPT